MQPKEITSTNTRAMKDIVKCAHCPKRIPKSEAYKIKSIITPRHLCIDCKLKYKARNES